MGFSVNGVPLFSGTNYYMWNGRMQVYLEVEGVDVWKLVLIGYNPPNKVKTTTHKEANKNNSMAMEVILEGLTYIQKKKIGKCNSAKELWLRLEQLYSNEEQEAEVMELMLEDLIDLHKEKIGKCNSIEELSYKINKLNLDEEQES